MMADNLVWIDLEMTGLDVNHDAIIEIAVLISDKDLNIIAQGPDLVIHQSKELMENMDEWCTRQHGESGLTAKVLQSRILLEDAEQIVLEFVQNHTKKGCCPLAGNSVHTDKMFLEKYMPNLSRHLHYRIVDVSTVKELCRRWYSEEYQKCPVKKERHRALDDIKESIEELKFYRRNIFKSLQLP
ncbi:oligoribonuclease, mitochondrial-like [Rhopilema esculentum]|uniref:oligoribonuclease, mitochondrial-like n=1 Tax=Rhopilema esculentum TaxID=499914 RepID=UPI0031D8D91B